MSNYNGILSSSPSQTSATTTNANTSTNKPRIRLIKTAFCSNRHNKFINHSNSKSKSNPSTKRNINKLNTVYKEALDKMDGIYGRASKILASEKDIEAHENMPTLYLKKKNGMATVSEDPLWERKTSEMSKKSLNNNNNTKNNNSNQRSLLHGNPPSIFNRAAAAKNGNNNDSMKVEHRNDGFTYIGPYKFPTHEFLKRQMTVEDFQTGNWRD